MRYETGRCLGAHATRTKIRDRRLDPLWHILLHESGAVGHVEIRAASRRLLVTLCEYYSGQVSWRYLGARPAPSESLWAWVRGTEHVKDWLKSPRAMRAPSFWPEEVEPLFGIHVPEPWEVANAIPMCLTKKKSPDWYGHDACTLISYCCGLSIYEISKIVGVNERAVLSHMQAGAKRLSEIPQFKLWAMNLEWNNLVSIALQGHTAQKRAQFLSEIQNNPLGLSKRDVDKAMESIVFKFGTESRMTPKRLMHRPIHKHVMICEPR